MCSIIYAYFILRVEPYDIVHCLFEHFKSSLGPNQPDVSFASISIKDTIFSRSVPLLSAMFIYFSYAFSLFCMKWWIHSISIPIPTTKESRPVLTLVLASQLTSQEEEVQLLERIELFNHQLKHNTYMAWCWEFLHGAFWSVCAASNLIMRYTYTFPFKTETP
jgi:hypothetical protein